MRVLFTVIVLVFSICLFPLQTNHAPLNNANIPTQFAETMSERVKSNSLRGSLLNDHFGVTPTLQLVTGGDGAYAFTWSSLTPTLNTETVTWIDSDWFGAENSTAIHGYEPSGGEKYDVEALYFDNDDDYFYLAIITSVPHYWEWSTDNWDVGIIDTRYSNIRVRPGDISLSLFSGTGRIENNSTVWHYNYGIDICHENREATTPYGAYSSCNMRDIFLGTALYRTSANDVPIDAKNYDPEDGQSDWHTSTHTGAVAAYWEHTNFDPYSSSNTVSLTFLGDANQGMVVDYYNLTFDEGHLENGEDTFVIEATIPRALFGNDNPVPGDSVGFRFTPGCRNDGNSLQAVAKLTTTIKEDDPLPVTLSTFSGIYFNGNAQLQWITQSETNNLGWNIFRSLSDNVEESLQINEIIINGAGTTTNPTQYSYIDESLPLYMYQNYVNNGDLVNYWLESISVSGETVLHGPVAITVIDEGQQYETPDIQKDLGLLPNYPNPFNPNTYISFNLKESSEVELTVFNTKGQKIKTIFKGYAEGNTDYPHIFQWDGTNEDGVSVKSGVYLYRLKSDNDSETKKMILLK